jgi:transposase InsO family protein
VTHGAVTTFLWTHVVPAYRPRRSSGPRRLDRWRAGVLRPFPDHVSRAGHRASAHQPRHAWTNGFVERLQGTLLSELWRIAFRRTYYTHVQLERDLQAYLRFYNRERPHQGYRLQGRTPVTVFIGTKAR